jgi:hypothetical protein
MYLPRAIRNEFSNPRLGVTLVLRRWTNRILGQFHRNDNLANVWQDDSLQFVFDLSVSPITFDFASYLAGAEVERRLRGLSSLVIIIVPGNEDGVRREQADYDAAVNAAARLSRVRNIILPILSFLPSVSGYVICGTRAQAQAVVSNNPAHVYPEGYSVALPRQPLKRVIHNHGGNGDAIFPMFQATDQAKHFIDEFFAREIGDRKPVVITLRNYDFSPERNSRNNDWLAFANRLDLTKYAPIFVHDTETVMRPPVVDLGDHIVCEAATWNLEIRMALYEAAWLNMALMHGPLELTWYNQKANYVVFINLGIAEQNSEISVQENGHVVGESLIFAKPTQKIIWEADTLECIEKQFAMIQKAMTSGQE